MAGCLLNEMHVTGAVGDSLPLVTDPPVAWVLRAQLRGGRYQSAHPFFVSEIVS